MSQPLGIEIKNSHLLRASFGLVAISLLLPGLFQFGPPQWLGGQGADHDTVERVAITPTLPEQSDSKSTGDQTSVVVASEKNVGGETATETAAATPAASTVESADPDNIGSGPVKSARVADGGDAVTALPDVQSPTRAAVDEKPRQLSGPNTESVTTDLAMAGQAALRAAPEQPAVRARVKKKPPVKTPPSSAKTAARAGAPSTPGVPPKPIYVTREFIKRIPATHVDLPTKSQKENFIGIVLPLILAANEEIDQRRSAIMRAASQNNRDSLVTWARLYRVKSDGKSLEDLERELLRRADAVPVSLALAQAAIESGWGTSRFARQGNALFGQWAWQADAGLKPAEASNSRAVVRSFPNLFGSVRAYMHNLNTHSSYATFRERRTMLRTRAAGDLGYQLANFMGNYAEIGDVYIGKLQQLIRSNSFGQYETARLR